MPDTTLGDAERAPAAGSHDHRLARPRRRLPRVIDWHLCASDLRQARAALTPLRPEQKELLRRSRLALAVGDAVLRPTQHSGEGAGAPHAAELFRQSLHWALEAADRSPSEATADPREELLEKACPDPEHGATARRLLSIEEPFIFFAELANEQQAATALFLRGCAVRALEVHEEPAQAVERLRALRLIRLAITPALAAVLVVTIMALRPEKVDLARGKAWSTSSVFATCEPEKGQCANVQTLIRFHTDYQNHPWFEYDMGEPVQFSAMTIRNRGDGNSERAVPLIVEVSDDRQSYREVAHRTSDFDVWKPSFTPQQARYIRLRVPRPTFLHLEEVKVHP